jgi:RNA polymerase subunit RPABC4/transcription elongation factor Spt4
MMDKQQCMICGGRGFTLINAGAVDLSNAYMLNRHLMPEYRRLLCDKCQGTGYTESPKTAILGKQKSRLADRLSIIKQNKKD